MINPNLKVDETHNLVEDLLGVPDDPEQVSTRTVERLCWRLADRIAALLTALANRCDVEMPVDIRQSIHQMEIARHEMHDALQSLRSFGSANRQPEHLTPRPSGEFAGPRNADGTPLKFITMYVPKAEETKHEVHNGYHSLQQEQRSLDAALHRLKR